MRIVEGIVCESPLVGKAIPKSEDNRPRSCLNYTCRKRVLCRYVAPPTYPTGALKLTHTCANLMSTPRAQTKTTVAATARQGSAPTEDLYEDDGLSVSSAASLERRKVGACGLALLTFFNVSGGPWGTEPIVSYAGPLPGFIFLFSMALFWGLPMSLVTCEMSSALPNNGGYVLW